MSIWPDAAAAEALAQLRQNKIASDISQSQYASDYALRKWQAQADNDYRYDALEQDQGQFDKSLAQQQDEFSKEYALKKDQFNWDKTTWQKDFDRAAYEFDKNLEANAKDATYQKALALWQQGITSKAVCDILGIPEGTTPFDIQLAKKEFELKKKTAGV